MRAVRWFSFCSITLLLLPLSLQTSWLRADEVTVDDQKQDIKATGRVRSNFFIEQAPDGSDGDMIPTDTALRDLEQFLLETLSQEFAINSVELHVDSDNFLGTSPAGDA